MLKGLKNTFKQKLIFIANTGYSSCNNKKIYRESLKVTVFRSD